MSARNAPEDENRKKLPGSKPQESATNATEFHLAAKTNFDIISSQDSDGTAGKPVVQSEGLPCSP